LGKGGSDRNKGWGIIFPCKRKAGTIGQGVGESAQEGASPVVAGLARLEKDVD